MEKAFDQVRTKDDVKALGNEGITEDLIKIIQSLYRKTKNYVRIKNEQSKL